MASKIVILGAGVTGLRIALNLNRKLPLKKEKIALVDRNDYHQLLYHLQKVCNESYREDEIVVPLKRLLRGNRIDFHKTEVLSINPSEKVVHTDSGDMDFDILVIALGSETNYHGLEGVQEHSLALDSYENAKKMRYAIESVFVEAAKRKRNPRIVIGGAGMTGVELMGEVADWYDLLNRESHERINEKYKICTAFNEEPEFLDEVDSYTPEDLTKKHITLITNGKGIIPSWDRNLVGKGEDKLEELGVDLCFNSCIDSADDDYVYISSSRDKYLADRLKIPYDLFIWSCGVKGNTVATTPSCWPSSDWKFKTKQGRIEVDEYCRAKGYDEIYVGGDCAYVTDDEGRPKSPTAHIAMEHADVIAHNIVASINEKRLKPYKFSHMGEIVTIGRTFAMADLFGFKFTGPLAKLMKKVVHWWYIHSIGGFRPTIW